MKKEEVLILDKSDLNLSGRKYWDEGNTITFFDLKIPFCQIARASFIFILTKDGDLQIIKERYKIVR